MTSSGGVIALCESEKQIDTLLARSDLKTRITDYLACNPEAAWALQNRGLSYLRLDDFQEGLADQTEPLIQTQLAWCRWVDEELQNAVPKFKSLNFRPARYNFFNLQLSMDAFFHRAYVLDQLMKIKHPREIIFFKNFDVGEDRKIPSEGSVFPFLIPLWAGHFGIQSTPLEAVPDDFWWKLTSQMLSRQEKMVYDLCHGDLLAVFKRGSRKLRTRIRRFLPMPAIRQKILLHRHYDINDVLVNEFSRKGLPWAQMDGVLHILEKSLSMDSKFRTELKNVWPILSTHKYLWEAFHPVFAWPASRALETVFKQFWFDRVPALWNAFQGAQKHLEKERPSALLLGIAAEPHVLGLIMAARKFKIPVILYQHGAAMGDIENSVWLHHDRFLADFILVYGEGEARYLKSNPTADEPMATSIVVGSTRLDDIRKSLSLNQEQKEKRETMRRRLLGGRKDKPLILYVPGIFAGPDFRLCYNTYQDISFFETRQKVAQLFHSHSEVYLMYKAFISVGKDPTLDVLNRQCPHAIPVRDLRLSEIQWAADAIIHEVPSTGMFESLLTPLPMIVYSDRIRDRMRPDAMQMLKRRAVVAETPQEFLDSLGKLLSESSYKPALKHPDTEYLTAFASCSDDGRSAHRAADAVEKILYGRR